MKLLKKVLIYLVHRQAHKQDELRKAYNRYQTLLILKEL